MGSVSKHNADKEQKILRLKHELIADLHLRRGVFWREVHDLRSRWTISPEVGLPPSYPDPPIPIPWPEQSDEEGQRLLVQWGYDLDYLRDETIPEEYRDDFYDVLGWRGFLAACVVYDPPETALLEFAEFGGPRRVGIHPLGHLSDPNIDPSDPNIDESLLLLVPQVVQLRDWIKAADAELWLQEKILQRLGERLNLDLRSMAADIVRNSPELREGYHELTEERNPFRYYIPVDEHTTAEGVEAARRAIQVAHRRKAPAGGRRPISPLVALQCAILHDDHNGTDPEDKRGKRWSYKRLAQEFSELGVRSERSAKEHVGFGRELQKN